MPELEFICSQCRRLLGKLPAGAPRAKFEEFLRSLETQGFTAVHHFGWFCSRSCGEEFFKRQDEWFKAHPKRDGNLS